MVAPCLHAVGVTIMGGSGVLVGGGLVILMLIAKVRLSKGGRREIAGGGRGAEMGSII